MQMVVLLCGREKSVLALMLEERRWNFGSQRLEFIDESENAVNHLARWVSIGPRRMGKLCKLL
jgi:hypothetical protein